VRPLSQIFASLPACRERKSVLGIEAGARIDHLSITSWSGDTEYEYFWSCVVLRVRNPEPYVGKRPA